MKSLIVADPVFKTETLFIVGCTAAQLLWYIKKKYRFTLVADVDAVGQMFTMADPPWRLIWCHEADSSVLVHELFHLVTRICQDKGIPIVAHHPNTECGDETAAYLMEFYWNKIKRLVK